jgi:hypothetical protein
MNQEMTMGEVWTSGTWTVKAGMQDEFVAAWREFAEWTARQYPGSRAWLLRDREHPLIFMSVGPFSGDAVVSEWRGSDGFRERIGRIRDILESVEPRTLDEVARVGG